MKITSYTIVHHQTKEINFFVKVFESLKQLFFTLIFLTGFAVSAFPQWCLSAYQENSRVNEFISYDGSLFAATTGSGVFRSDDDGATWGKLNHSVLLTDARWIIANDTVIVVAGSYADPVCSFDKGTNWVPVGLGPGAGEIDLLARTCDGLLASSLGRLMKFDPRQKSWSVFSATPMNSKILSLSCSYPYLLAGTNWLGPYYSPNWGGYWAQSEVEGTHTPAFVSFAEMDEIYYAITDSSGLFKSGDFGKTWVKVESNLPEEPMNLQVWNETLIAAGSSGVYYSGDRGLTWVTWNSGLVIPLTTVGSIPSMLVTGDRLIIGGTRIWRRSLSEMAASARGIERPALKVYPNPTPGPVCLTGVTDDARVEVFSAVGQSVLSGRLLNDMFDMGSLPNGIYYLRIEGEENPVMIKIVKQ